MTERHDFQTVHDALHAAVNLSALIDAADMLVNEVNSTDPALNSLHALLPLIAREAEALKTGLDHLDMRQRREGTHAA